MPTARAGHFLIWDLVCREAPVMKSKRRLAKLEAALGIDRPCPHCWPVVYFDDEPEPSPFCSTCGREVEVHHIVEVVVDENGKEIPEDQLNLDDCRLIGQ